MDALITTLSPANSAPDMGQGHHGGQVFQNSLNVLQRRAGTGKPSSAFTARKAFPAKLLVSHGHETAGANPLAAVSRTDGTPGGDSSDGRREQKLAGFVERPVVFSRSPAETGDRAAAGGKKR